MTILNRSGFSFHGGGDCGSLWYSTGTVQLEDILAVATKAAFNDRPFLNIIRSVIEDRKDIISLTPTSRKRLFKTYHYNSKMELSFNTVFDYLVFVGGHIIMLKIEHFMRFWNKGC